MKLPLLIAGSPNKIVDCAKVKIADGDWKVSIENLLDSILQFSVNNSLVPIMEMIKGPATIQVCFLERGKENNLNIYIEKCL